MRKMAVCLLVLMAAGCAMGPDYQRPVIKSPDAFRMAEEAAGAAPSIANLPWWELLQDTELQKLIRLALEGNKDLRRAVATVEEYESRLFVSRTDFAPKLDGTGNAPAFGRKAVFLFPGFSNPFNYYLQGNLSWELDIWGRIRRRPKRHSMICCPRRKIVERSSCSWSATSRKPTLSSCSSTCSSISRNERSPPGRSRSGSRRLGFDKA